MSGGNPG